MKRLIISIFILILLAFNIEARVKVNGIAQKGAKSVTVSPTTYKLMETFPNCTITVYLTGTLTLATIYSDDAGTLKANPFTANSDASYNFYIDKGEYDIKFSGTGISSPFTLSDITISEEITFPLTNIRLEKTSAYTLVNADIAKTIVLRGNAFYTLTINAASGYNAEFSVMILNEDSVRAKRITADGVSSFLLYPKQSVILFNQDNAWNFHGKSRWNIPSATIMYVDVANGNDLNDGLAAGVGNALATPQAAIDKAKADFDFSLVKLPVVIQLADGTYDATNAPVVLVNGPFAPYQPSTLVFPSANEPPVLIKGNAAAPANVVLNSIGGDSAVLVLIGGQIGIQDVKLTATTGHGIHLGQAVAFFGNIIFGATGGSKIYSGHNSVIENYSSFFIEGNCTSVLTADFNSTIYLSAATMTLLNSFTVTSGFALSQGSSEISLVNVTINLNANTVTGLKYITRSAGVIRTGTNNVAYFPGNADGVDVGWGSFDNQGRVDLAFQQMLFKGLGTGGVTVGEAPFSNSYGAISLNGPLAGVNYNFASSPTDLNLYMNRPTGADILWRENNNATPQLALKGTTGRFGIGTLTPTTLLDINSDLFRLRTAKTPASAVAACDVGSIAWDANFVYICIAANTWKRSAIATW